MCAVYTPTKGGLLAWIARRIELFGITRTLAWAEVDREALAREVESGPRRLRQLDHDLEVLRVREVILRGTR